MGKDIGEGMERNIFFWSATNFTVSKTLPNTFYWIFISLR